MTHPDKQQDQQAQDHLDRADDGSDLLTNQNLAAEAVQPVIPVKLKKKAARLSRPSVSNHFFKWGSLCLLLLTLLIIVSWWASTQIPQGPTEKINQLRTAYYQLGDTINLGLNGDVQALSDLNRRSDQITQILLTLPVDAEQKRALNQAWQPMQASIQMLTEYRQAIARLPQFQQRLEKELYELIKALQIVGQRMAESSTYSLETVRRLDELVYHAQRLDAYSLRLLKGRTEVMASSTAVLTDTVHVLTKQLNELIEGDPATGVQSLKGSAEEDVALEAQMVLGDATEDVAQLVENSPEIIELRQAIQTLHSSQNGFLSQLEHYSADIDQQSAQTTSYLWLTNIFMFAALLSCVVIFILLQLDQRQRMQHAQTMMREEQERSQKHQQAILRLVHELEPVGQGDLSVELTVTEDSTGIIADSINMMITDLRQLVSVFRHTADTVGQTSADMLGGSGHIAEQASAQAVFIKEGYGHASQACQHIQQAYNGLSSLLKTTEVSQHHIGLLAEQSRIHVPVLSHLHESIEQLPTQMQRIIEKMTQIQDLALVTQQMADQTKILSLNAALQASTADRVGHSRFVDEVQPLADRSLFASNKMGVLCQAILTELSTSTHALIHCAGDVSTSWQCGQQIMEQVDVLQNEASCVSDCIKEIAEVSRQSYVFMSQMTQSLHQAHQITTENMQYEAKTRNTVGEFAALTHALHNAVSRFTVAESATLNTKTTASHTNAPFKEVVV